MKRLGAETDRLNGMSMPRLCLLFGKSFQAYYQHADSISKQMKMEMMVVKFAKEIRSINPSISPDKIQILYKRRFGTNY